jgi:arsenate reductase-like glutaredoxin family protein
MIFLFFRYRKRNYIESNSSLQELQEIETKLIKLKASTISKNNLDTILSISHYSYETIKTRRSLLINQLNKKGNIKIERVRKQDDKRFYDYKIS